MEHVRVGEDEVVAAADRRALVLRRVAVVDRLAQVRRPQRAPACAPGPGPAPWSGRGRGRGASASRGDPVEHRQVEGEALARGGAAGDHQVGVRRRLAGRELVRVELLDAAARAAPRRSRGRARLGSGHGAGAAVRLGGLGDDPPVAARGVDRNGPRVLEQAAARHQAARPSAAAAGREISPATRIACSDDRSWMRRTSAPSRTASATAATVPHSRSPGAQPLLPGPGQHRADEVLARERDVERQAQLAQLAEPAQDLQVLVGAEVEVESGVDRDLLLRDAKPARQLDSPLEPALAGGRRRRRNRRQGRSTRGGPSMCMRT